MRRAEGKLSLEHSSTDVTEAHFCDADGPYDVVILDMALSQLVLALMQVSQHTHTHARIHTHCTHLLLLAVVWLLMLMIIDSMWFLESESRWVFVWV